MHLENLALYGIHVYMYIAQGRVEMLTFFLTHTVLCSVRTVGNGGTLCEHCVATTPSCTSVSHCVCTVCVHTHVYVHVHVHACGGRKREYTFVCECWWVCLYTCMCVWVCIQCVEE